MCLTADTSVSAHPALDTLDRDSDKGADSDQVSPYADMVDYCEELDEIVQSARDAFSSVKDNAMWAAAHTYFLWLKTTESSYAGYWFSKQVEARNAKIAEMNKAYKANTYPGDAENGLAAGEKYTKIRARDGASKFTLVVKYALDFIHPKQATNVSRYVLVLEWLDGQFEHTVVGSADEMFHAMVDAGGFEAVVRVQRSINNKSAVKPASTQKATPTSKYEVLKEAACLHEVPFDAKHANNNFVVLIGRYAAGNVQIVGELKMTQARLDQEVANLDEMYFQPPVAA